MIQLNKDQENVVSKAVEWYKKSSEQVFQYSGAAGTGKSVVLNAIIERLGLKSSEVAPVSYTGAAALVMRNKGLITAKTIHSTIYEPIEVPMTDDNGNTIMNTYLNKPRMTLRYVKRNSLPGVKLILVDEASMVPMDIAKHLESFGIKIIACGDLNQLPPVGGKSAYLTKGKVHYLREIMRQAQNSGIVYLANLVLQGKPISSGVYGNAIVLDKYDRNYLDIIKNKDMILCPNNALRDEINLQCRKELFGIDNLDKDPVHGEKLICRRNMWKVISDETPLVNGLIGTVGNYPDVGSIGYKGEVMNIDLVTPYTTFKNLPMDREYFKTRDTKRRDMLRRETYKGSYAKLELANAITVHLSQGSQFRSGAFVDDGVFGSKDYTTRLIYTAITRFSDEFIYVKLQENEPYSAFDNFPF